MYSEGFLQYLMSEELSKIDGINWLTLFVRDCIHMKVFILIKNKIIPGQKTYPCYNHFFISSTPSSYLLILSILTLQTIPWTIINHSHQFHLYL